MPRRLVHVLLSLLLLVSQQLSLSHGYTHWSEVQESLSQARAEASGERDGGGKLPKPVLHDLCGHCAASAQLAFALPSAIRRFVPAELSYAVPSIAQPVGICRLASCPFRSRAPPELG